MKQIKEDFEMAMQQEDGMKYEPKDGLKKLFFKKGLREAWSCAGILVRMGIDERKKVFGGSCPFAMLIDPVNSFSPETVVERLEGYLEASGQHSGEDACSPEGPDDSGRISHKPIPPTNPKSIRRAERRRVRRLTAVHLRFYDGFTAEEAMAMVKSLSIEQCDALRHPKRIEDEEFIANLAEKRLGKIGIDPSRIGILVENIFHNEAIHSEPNKSEIAEEGS